MRTDAEIVAETNELAAYLLAELIGTGYTVPEGHKFYEAEEPRSKKAWDHAVRIMEMTTATEVSGALEAVLAHEPCCYQSPTGELITGILETVPLRSHITTIRPDGESVEYAGGSEVFWDDQQAVLRNGSFVFLDDDGNQFAFSQLTPIRKDKSA